MSLPGGQVQSLFAALLLSTTGSHSREQIAGLLWPDASPERAGRILSDLLYRLRRSLGEGWLVIERDRVALDPGGGLWVDVWEWERLLASGDLAQVEEALALYRGDLLPEVYEDWILPYRVALRERYLWGLGRVAEAAEQEGELEKAFLFYHRLSFADPLSEAAHCGLMRVYARQGRQGAALKQYARLCRLLEEELQAEPLPETRLLAEAIRAEQGAELGQAALPRPFVGRRQERALLLRAVEQALAGRGGVVLVEGEPGMGKSRLLEEVARGAAWRGLTVAWGKAGELTGTTPYAPLDGALQTVLPGPRADRFRAQLSPVVADTIGALIPRLRPGPQSQGASPGDLPAALFQLLESLGGVQPLLLILDDIQWAGRAFWEVLGFASKLHELPVLLILAYRPGELRADAAAWRALRDLDLEAGPQRLALAGLSAAECADLAGDLGHALTGEQAFALQQATGGNPLHVQEALAALDERTPQPGSLTALLRRRLAMLSPDARESLDVAAVLGREFTHGAWQAVAGGALLDALPALVEGRFIEETAEGYRFQHDLVREQVYQTISPDRLRRLHLESAETLRREGAAPETLAWHFEQADARVEAIHHHRLAGEQAINAYAYEDALRHFDRALALLGGSQADPATYLTILAERQRMLRVLLRIPEWRRDLDEIERLAGASSDAPTLLDALEARLSLHILDSDVQAMRRTAARALALAAELGDARAESRILATLGWHLSESLGLSSEALPSLQRAAELAGAIQDQGLLVSALCRLSFAQRAAGQYEAAWGSATQALIQTEIRVELHPARAHALKSVADAAWDLARWETARETMQRALQLYEGLSDPWAAGAAYYNFSLIASGMGRHGEAIEAAERLVRIGTQAGLAPDSVYGLWHRAALARAHVLAGDLAAAARLLAALRNESAHEGRALLALLVAEGYFELARGSPREALAPLARALRLWQKTGIAGDVEVVLLHAVAASRAGDSAAARASLEQAERALGAGGLPRLEILRRFARAEVSGAAADMEAVHQEIRRQAALFDDPKLRADFLERAPFHREVATRLQDLRHSPGWRVVRLTSLDAPLGRPLTDADRVRVIWTVDAGEGDAAVLHREGPVGLRRHRLRRLLAEAAAQGAAPTDDDLAEALAVSRRTIVRDMQALARAGAVLSTRRRVRRPGESPTR